MDGNLAPCRANGRKVKRRAKIFAPKAEYTILSANAEVWPIL
jgi:hypothetical protein